MHNQTEAEASVDIVGAVFANHFREYDGALLAGALEVEDPDLRLVNTGCDRLAVVDELLSLNAAERDRERIRELEGQVAILKAMASAPKPVAMTMDPPFASYDGGLVVVLEDGTCFQRVWQGKLGIMTWQQLETVPGTPADLAEQFGRHPNLRTA